MNSVLRMYTPTTILLHQGHLSVQCSTRESVQTGAQRGSASSWQTPAHKTAVPIPDHGMADVAFLAGYLPGCDPLLRHSHCAIGSGAVAQRMKTRNLCAGFIATEDGTTPAVQQSCQDVRVIGGIDWVARQRRAESRLQPEGHCRIVKDAFYLRQFRCTRQLSHDVAQAGPSASPKATACRVGPWEGEGTTGAGCSK